MKKLQNLGKILSKEELKKIKGGDGGDPGLCTQGSCGSNGEDQGCSALGHGCICHNDSPWVCRTGR